MHFKELPMTTGHDISVLNSLIETTLDSMKGFNEAAEDSNGSHTAFFREMAGERSACASQLQARVTALGGDPEEHSSYTAAAHRGFMNLKEAIVGSDERAVVEEVERGEDYIKGKYEAALRDTDLTPETRQVIEQAYASVRKGHDRASALKHQMAD
jgi:uncharacterized protein (TIGR02284 family)